MFQFRRFPTYAYLIQRRLTEYCSAGFPHSVILGSMLMCSSPRLIAACHDLLRLLMPRHSPCALFSLTSPRSPAAQSFWFSRIMQAPDRFHRSLCYPLKVHKFSLFPLCCLLAFEIFIVQFSRCTLWPLSRSDGNARTPAQALLSDLGGGYRTRTGGPLLAKQVLYQLS